MLTPTVGKIHQYGTATLHCRNYHANHKIINSCQSFSFPALTVKIWRPFTDICLRKTITISKYLGNHSPCCVQNSPSYTGSIKNLEAQKIACKPTSQVHASVHVCPNELDFRTKNALAYNVLKHPNTRFSETHTHTKTSILIRVDYNTS